MAASCREAGEKRLDGRHVVELDDLHMVPPQVCPSVGIRQGFNLSRSFLGPPGAGSGLRHPEPYLAICR